MKHTGVRTSDYQKPIRAKAKEWQVVIKKIIIFNNRVKVNFNIKIMTPNNIPCSEDFHIRAVLIKSSVGRTSEGSSNDGVIGWLGQATMEVQTVKRLVWVVMVVGGLAKCSSWGYSRVLRL